MSIYPRGKNTWRCYMDHPNPPNKKRQQLTTTIKASSEQEAKALYDEWKVEMRKKYRSKINTFDFTVEELYEKWKDYNLKKIKAKKITQSTWGTYRAVFLNLLPFIGSELCNELDAEKLVQAFDYIVEEKDLANSNIYYHFKILKQLYNYGINQGIVTVNWPLIYYKREELILPEKEITPAQVFEQKQAQKLLDASWNPKFYLLHLIIYFALETGMRRGEILGLTWDNFREDGFLKVEKQLKKDKAGFHFADLKSKRSRRSFFIKEENLIKTIKKHKWIQENQKALLGKAYTDNNLVFCWDDGQFINPDLVTNWFRNLAQKVGLPGCHLHLCRHTFASNALRAGIKIEELSEQLGHHDPSFTYKVYVHLFEDAKKEIADKYSRYRQENPLRSNLLN